MRRSRWIGLIAFTVAAVAMGYWASSESGKRVAAPQLSPILRNRQLIATALKQNPGRERAWLDSSIRERMNDRTFLLAALPYDSISPGILDTLASSPDLGVALEAVRNPNTPAVTLERVYNRAQTYPDYFSQALAAHPRTPPTILRELYRATGVDSTSELAIWLAGNPATPRDILAVIARSASDAHVIGVLLENPSLDCWLQGQLARNLMNRQNRDADNPNVQRLTELIPTCTPGAAL